MKIIHFADVHLGMENYGKINSKTGLNSRLDDFLKSFDTIVQYALSKKVDLAAFAGDAYKTRDPSPTYQREFSKRIYQIASAGIPVVMVVGNHDFPNAIGKADTLEIFPTLNVPNITIFQKPDIKIIKTKSGPIQVAGLPWLTRSQLLTNKEFTRGTSKELNELAGQKITEKVEYLSSRVNKKLPSILIAHITVENAVYGTERQVMIGSEPIVSLASLRQSNFNYVALGHLHKYQEIINPPTGGPHTIYSGAIERVDFGEEHEDKGFVTIKIAQENNKLKIKTNFIKLDSRPFITIKTKISESDTNPTATIISEIKKHNIKDAVVKVIINISNEQSPQVEEGKIREALKTANFIAAINKEIQQADRISLDNGFSDELLSLSTVGMLEKYLKSKKIKSPQIEILKKETEKLLEEIALS
ncbi:hypothetical protein A2V71_02700 [Candidatus Berkelbacteria bacterium RBG_13_40_8]|uniref:Nuclease SbcCD subunit D n=1 Tax=Candidatus Berkelbacteria bacterium RBG_13_40_8 TaxID=1797467 RepID=A0A1F5DNI9_9BACT|nr:MAG: hypothetical protein A2V71_02700 [Candidatus Berkelbacteria bacterium RBG_13_40_8]